MGFFLRNNGFVTTSTKHLLNLITNYNTLKEDFFQIEYTLRGGNSICLLKVTIRNNNCI